jgi:hypothetical protein
MGATGSDRAAAGGAGSEGKGTARPGIRTFGIEEELLLVDPRVG